MTKYSEQFKLEVVQDYLAAGSAGLRAVAQRHGIPSHFTVRKWVLVIRFDSMDTLGLRIWSVNGLFQALQKPRSERRPLGFDL